MGNLHFLVLPSGKRLQKTMERSTIFHGKISTISTGPCSIATLNYQRVGHDPSFWGSNFDPIYAIYRCIIDEFSYLS